MMQVNDDYYEDLNPVRAKAVLSAFRKGKATKPGPQGDRKGSEPASGLTSLTFGST